MSRNVTIKLWNIVKCPKTLSSLHCDNSATSVSHQVSMDTLFLRKVADHSGGIKKKSSFI